MKLLLKEVKIKSVYQLKQTYSQTDTWAQFFSSRKEDGASTGCIYQAKSSLLCLPLNLAVEIQL